VTLASSERQWLFAMLGALEEPAAAAAFPSDDPTFMAVARHHRLSPLLSASCAGTLPAPIAEAFRRDRVVTTARAMILGQVAEECVWALAADDIPTIVLKGLDYGTRLYDAAGVRPTADVDLLVPNESRRRAFAVLDRLGFEPQAAAPGFDDADYHEVAWTRRGAEVDLHLGLAPFARCRIDYAQVWKEAEPLQLGQTKTWALARPHAAIFQALHMAIDHFDVPAIYLVDLARLLGPDQIDPVRALARSWHCARPLATAVALAARFLPRFGVAAPTATPSPGARGVVERYGSTRPLPRTTQLYRKLVHFDTPVEAVRYLAVQSRRNLGELLERRVRHRTARERLGPLP
jgi:putative nucleotidyltransferase-like protein